MDGLQVGVVRPDVLKELFKYPEVFVIKDKEKSKVVELNPAFRDYNERTEQVDRVLRQFRQDDVFFPLKGWRDEVNLIRFFFCFIRKHSNIHWNHCYFFQCYDVKAGHKALLKMDRSATCLFGIRNYGVDINGMTKVKTIEFSMEIDWLLFFVVRLCATSKIRIVHLVTATIGHETNMARQMG